MLTVAERLFQQLISREALEALIGQPEDASFDCKVWSNRDEANRGSIAKAACGFANGAGGVIIIGLSASGRGADTPDVVNGVAPVSNRQAVASQALDYLLKFVEPGIEGIEVRTIEDAVSAPSGFVLLYIPATEGSVRRSRIDWKFYVRISSGTVPMEYFQIEERFGRRPHPRLSFEIRDIGMTEGAGYIQQPLRIFSIGLKNEGRGIAKFPGIRFRRTTDLRHSDFGIDGNGALGLPFRGSEPEWVVFRGGVDDIIFPDETRWVSKLIQVALHIGDRGLDPEGDPPMRFRSAEEVWRCDELALKYEIFAEGTSTQAGVYVLTEQSYTRPSWRR